MKSNTIKRNLLTKQSWRSGHAAARARLSLSYACHDDGGHGSSPRVQRPDEVFSLQEIEGFCRGVHLTVLLGDARQEKGLGTGGGFHRVLL